MTVEVRGRHGKAMVRDEKVGDGEELWSDGGAGKGKKRWVIDGRVPCLEALGYEEQQLSVSNSGELAETIVGERWLGTGWGTKESAWRMLKSCVSICRSKPAGPASCTFTCIM